MTEEEFINKIKDIKVNVPDEYFFLEYNKLIYDILEENKQLKENIPKAIEWAINSGLYRAEVFELRSILESSSDSNE